MNEQILTTEISFVPYDYETGQTSRIAPVLTIRYHQIDGWTVIGTFPRPLRNGDTGVNQGASGPTLALKSVAVTIEAIERLYSVTYRMENL